MIEEISKNIADLSDDIWAQYVYAKEPLRGKVSFEDYYEKYYKVAIEEGKNVAQDYKGQSIQDILKSLDANIVMQEMQSGESIYNFAMFNEPKEIIIYKQNAEESQEIVDSIEDERFKGVKIVDMLLAHEGFHMLESKYKDLFIYQPHISLWKIFKFENISKLVSLEEVAAMSFAKELLNMKVNPYCFDVIMCMSRAPGRAKELYNYLMGLVKE